jgi:adenosylhomocysteine nucleosidase
VDDINTPAILFALSREGHAFLRAFPVREAVPLTACKARLCGPASSSVLVVETGVGHERMSRALDWLLQKPAIGGSAYVPRLVISAGFSGALQEDLRVGDLILGTEVIAADGICHKVTWPGDAVGGGQSPLRRGRLVTVTRTIAAPEEKRALARQHGALAVDMETGTIARRCAEQGIPFACIRAISDDAHDVLSPELDYVIVNGAVSLRRLAGCLVRRPALAVELWRLAKNTRLAAERLGTALGELLTWTGSKQA